MKEILQRIYELILGPVIEVLRKLWEMPAEDFLGLLWAVVGPLVKFFGIVIVAMVLVIFTIYIVAFIAKGIQAIAVHFKRKNRS